ncbi:MAG: amidase [Verrucomicrobiales bacterium]|nr:amidase [Verrucomicrobiales bacterium]|tara:strand:- start:3699 stop:4454 length:756 start_codon:yes stop_codon:yes gene_type:complete
MKFEEMTAPKIRGLDQENTVFVQPIAALEQHGPHMPTGTDRMICGAIAHAVEERNADSMLLMPTYWLGASAHHLRLGATSSADLQTYIETLCELAIPHLENGFRRFIFLNGHGGNIDPMKVALRELQKDFPDVLLAGASYWSIAEEVVANGLDGPHKFVGHACEFETSMIMHLRPELVVTEELRDAGELGAGNIEGLFLPRDMKHRTKEGCTGRPDLATAEKGAKMFAGIVDRVDIAVRAILAEPLPEQAC